MLAVFKHAETALKVNSSSALSVAWQYEVCIGAGGMDWGGLCGVLLFMKTKLQRKPAKKGGTSHWESSG